VSFLNRSLGSAPLKFFRLHTQLKTATKLNILLTFVVRIHSADADALHQIGIGPVAQAQQLSFDDLPTPNRGSRSTATANNASRASSPIDRRSGNTTGGGEPASITAATTGSVVRVSTYLE